MFILSLNGSKVTAASGMGFYSRVDPGIVKYRFKSAPKREFQPGITKAERSPLIFYYTSYKLTSKNAVPMALRFLLIEPTVYALLDTLRSKPRCLFSWIFRGNCKRERRLVLPISMSIYKYTLIRSEHRQAN